jgi:N-methylhydantoinase B
MNEEVWELILANVRTPEERRGDFEAQLAAQRVGEDGLAQLASRYSSVTVAVHGVALHEYSESMMRDLIDRIAPGEYAFADALDDDGQTSEAVPIRVCIRRQVGDTDLEIDFTGSAPQQLGSINAVEAVTISATLYVMRCLQLEDVPVNEGSLAPLHVVAPPGSVVAAERPSAVAGGNVETSQRIVDVLFGAFARCLPQTAPAASQGTMNNLTLGGRDPQTGAPFAYYETMGGGMGARPGQDGMSGLHDHMSNTLNTPVEALESSLPIRVARYELRRGTGGRGRHHGGDGLRRDLEFLAQADVSILSDRRRLAPYGLAGGQPGATGINVLIRDGHQEQLPGKVRFTVQSGDVLSIRTPGGGGHGGLPESAGR